MTSIVGSRELAVEIAKDFVARADGEQAEPYLKLALEDDKTCTTATLLLGVLAMQRGDLASAMGYAREAHRRAPAWPLPLQLIEKGERGL